jgi:peroxiredoxin
MKARLHVPFEILSDADLVLASALGLPTFQAEGMTLLKRLTIIVRAGRIEKVLYPVSHPADNPREVLMYLRNLQV